MTEDSKSETGHESQETGQTVPHQQPSPKDTDSGSPHSQNEPFFHVDSPVSNETTRTQVARETKETYNNYRKNRKTKDHTWWGSKHYEPERGDPDREFMFARNMPVSNQEIEDAQQAYDSIIIDPDTGKLNPLGPHLRPTTPPMERVEKQVKGLMDQGVDVPSELVKEMIHHFTSNNGMHSALLIWCSGQKDVPVEYVNELIKSIDRLKLEMATQQCDVIEKLDQAIRDCEEKEVRCQQLQSENAKLEMEVQRLKEETEKLQQEKREKGDIQNEPSDSKREEEKTGLEDSAQESGDQQAEDPPTQHNEHSIPPPATMQLPRTPLTSAREAPESSQASPLSPVTKERLEKKVSEAESERDMFLDQLDHEQRKTTKLSGKMKDLEKKLRSVRAAQSNDSASAFSPGSKRSAGDIQKDGRRDQVKELQSQVQSLKEELRASNDGIRVLGKANYTTVDTLINAVREENKGTNKEQAPSLVDRINYLNLVCFFRTRNYLQLSLRERDHTLARILLNDANKWVKSCKEDFETMDPSVNLQIEASMLILHGVRKVLTTKDKDVMVEGIKYVKYGRDELNKFSKNDPFAQLVQLADSIIQTTKYDEEQNSLGIKKLPFNPFGRKNKLTYAKIQETIKDNPAMKAEALCLTGVHSPLSPQKWRKDK